MQAILISAVRRTRRRRGLPRHGGLRRQLPDIKIVIGLWGTEEGNGSARERLLKLGVDEVVTRIAEAPDVLRQLPTARRRRSNQEASKRTARR